MAAKSQEVVTTVMILAVFGLLTLMGPFLLNRILGLFRHTFQEYIFADVDEATVEAIGIDMLKELAIILGPVFLAAMMAALLANFLQVGFMFSTDPIRMQLERLNPVQGFRRIFSLRSVVEMLKSILKVLIIGYIAFLFLWKNVGQLLKLVYVPTEQSLSVLASLTSKMGLNTGIGLAVLAVLDYMYQKFEFEKNIRMSKQDIKEELKMTEGHPLIKSKIKQTQREIAMRRMMQEVPKADVVITNPTHFAVALKYDEKKSDAPIVVAKGVDYVAKKIIQVARENGVITVENRPLARALYDQVKIGQAIPESFYKAVAEILAYVYRMQGKI